MMLALDPSLKKKKGAAYFNIDEDIDDEWISEHQAFLVEEQRQKIQKKFDKDNEKLAAEGEKEMKAKELEERMEAARELEKKFNRENKTGKVEVEGKGTTVEKLETNITKLEQRVDNMSVQAQDKEDNKEVALGTSKIVGSSVRLPIYKANMNRITSTPVSQRFSPSDSTSPSRNSSPRPYVRSLNGPSNQLMRTGNSKRWTDFSSRVSWEIPWVSRIIGTFIRIIAVFCLTYHIIIT